MNHPGLRYLLHPKQPPNPTYQSPIPWTTHWTWADDPVNLVNRRGSIQSAIYYEIAWPAFERAYLALWNTHTTT